MADERHSKKTTIQPTKNAADDEWAAREAAARRAGRLTGLAGIGNPCRLREWRVARSLDVLHRQVDAMAPHRRKDSDGTIGDAAHCARESDHNPHVSDGDMGVVTAIDITHDPLRGCDCTMLAEALRTSRDARIKYVIWNARMFASYIKAGQVAWEWRVYGGPNPHDRHMHVSVVGAKPLFDSTAPWTV